MDPYKKEWVGTLVFFGLYLLMGHTAIWALLFGIDNDFRILGFPAHFFLVLMTGWFGVLAVSIAWNRWADRLDEEITSQDAKPDDR